MSRSIQFRRTILALSCGSLLAGSAAASPQLYEFNGTKADDRLGLSLANAGDVTGDGINDLVVGVPEDGNFLSAGNGFIQIFSGATGDHHQTIDGDPAGFAFGMAVDGNFDADGDNVPDIVVGSPFSEYGGTTASGHVAVISGATGLEIRSAFGELAHERIGQAVAGLGDLDGDGFDEFAAGSFTANGDKGVVRVYDGETGAEMYQYDGVGSGDRIGISISRLGDVDGDTRPDFVVGSAFDGFYVYSGATGNEIRHTTIITEETLGGSVSNIEDVTGDGIEDVIVGAHQIDFFSPGPGRVYVFNGATGAEAFHIDGAAAGDAFGEVVAEAGDWDVDGTSDILVSAFPSSGPSFVSVRSGDDGAELATFSPDVEGDHLGRSIAGLGVLTGGGVCVAAGAPDVEGTFFLEGMARVYESPNSGGCTGGTTVYCNTNSNSTGFPAGTSISGSTSVAAANLQLLATNCPPNKPGLFFYGPNQISVPFGNGVRCVGGMVQRLTVTFTDGVGTATKDLFLDPNNGINAAGTWNFQYWFRDIPGGGAEFNTSDGLEVVFCP